MGFCGGISRRGMKGEMREPLFLSFFKVLNS